MGKSPLTARVHLWYYSKRKGFHQWATDSIMIVLPRAMMYSDLTDIYLHENLRDYYFKGFYESQILHHAEKATESKT